MNAIAPSPRSTCWVQIGDSGAGLDLLAPDWSRVSMTDLATSLSRLPWRNGATRGTHPYSLAQRAVGAAWLVHTMTRGDARLAALALLHDAHLAALGPMPAGVCRAIGAASVMALEDRLRAALLRHHNLPAEMAYHAALELPFARLLATELRDIALPGEAEAWPYSPLTTPLAEPIAPVPASVAHARFAGAAAALGLMG